jgi:hypothetical protein
VTREANSAFSIKKAIYYLLEEGGTGVLVFKRRSALIGRTERIIYISYHGFLRN